MKIEYDASASIMIQHNASAAFTGVELGRASATIGPVVFRARRPGTDAHAISVKIAENGSGVSVTVSMDSVVLVTVRSPTGLAGDVVREVNAKARAYLRATTASPGSSVTLGSATLSGGLDPEITGGCRYKYSATHGGLFYFDQPQNYVITQVEGRFPSLAVDTSVYVDVMNLDEGMSPIADEWSPVFSALLTSSTQGFIITDVKCQILPLRAMRVRMNSPGQVRVQVRREGAASSA